MPIRRNRQSPNPRTRNEGGGQEGKETFKWKAPAIIGAIGAAIPLIADVSNRLHEFPVKFGIGVMLCALSFWIYELLTWMAQWYPVLKGKLFKWGIPGVCLVLLISAEVFIYKRYPQSSEPLFSIRARAWNIETKNPKYFILWNNGGAQVKSPVQVAMFVQFANLSGKPMAVDSYRFEGLAGELQWIEMASVLPNLGWLVSVSYTNNTITGARRLFCSESFPEKVTNTTVSEEPFGSWVFLESPTNDFDHGSIRLKLRIRGVEHVANVEFDDAANSLDIRTQDANGLLPQQDRVEDISKVEELQYSQYLKGR